MCTTDNENVGLSPMIVLLIVRLSKCPKTSIKIGKGKGHRIASTNLRLATFGQCLIYRKQ